MQSALPGFETNSWRKERAPPYRESPRLSQFPPSAPGHPSQASLMAGGISGAGGEFPSVLGRCFLHTKINHRITCALTCSEKAAANLSDQRELGLCFCPAHLHLAALFAWLQQRPRNPNLQQRAWSRACSPQVRCGARCQCPRGEQRSLPRGPLVLYARGLGSAVEERCRLCHGHACAVLLVEELTL